MRKYLFTVVLLLSFFVIIVPLSAQEVNESSGTDNSVQFGIGVALNSFLKNFSYGDNLPTIYIPMNISDKFKIEPELSYYSSSGKNENVEQENTSMAIGVGLFGTTNYEKSLFYYGFRFSYLNSKTKYSFQDEVDRERTSNRFMLGPAVGGEYFFIKHFSVGGEIGFQFTVKKDEETNFEDYLPGSSVNGTDVRIFLRFYY